LQFHSLRHHPVANGSAAIATPALALVPLIDGSIVNQYYQEKKLTAVPTTMQDISSRGGALHKSHQN
jgi:hypothetical protein